MKTAAKTIAALAALIATAGVLYLAPSRIAAAMDKPKSGGGYVVKAQVDRKLARNHHSPATKGGSFIETASIETADVRSARQIALP